MDSMIKVEDVSMKFNLGIEKNFSLKLFFINMFKPKKKDEKKDDKRIEADSIDELIAAIKAKLYPEESQDKATEESE